MHILVLNAGSSSLKCVAFDEETLNELHRGQVSGIGTLQKFVAAGETKELPADTGFAESLSLIRDWLDTKGVKPSALGHRLVHGGTRFVQPVQVDEAKLRELENLRSLAPLHLPFGLLVLNKTRVLFPKLRHIACFDTAFHATQPELTTRLPLPRAYFDKGYRRYGFHGLNYEHVVGELR